MSQRPHLLAERRWIALGILVALALGQAGTMIVTAFATRDIFLALRHGAGTPPFLALAQIGVAGFGLCLLRALEARLGEAAGQSYAAAIRKTLFCHITHMPMRDLARRRSGALALRYVGDLAAFKGWIARGVVRLVSASITLPASLLVLYLLEPLLFLAAIVPFAGVLWGIWRLGAPLQTAHADLRARRTRLAAEMAERLPQGIALRRSGRMGTELKRLTERSAALRRAGVRRAWLAALVRALPDAGSGVAAALCLSASIWIGLDVADAVAALTALAMVVLPLRHLADVADRRRAYLVAAAKLDQLLAAPRLPAAATDQGDDSAPAISIRNARLMGGAPFDLTLGRGEVRRLAGPPGAGKTGLLLALAGFDRAAPSDRFAVCGAAPGALSPGRSLYLGTKAPSLRGTLRRDISIGLERVPEDQTILHVLDQAGLADLLKRLGGLDGKIGEGRRDLTATEQARLHLARAMLARPDLALIDADEIGLRERPLAQLIAHLEEIGAAALIVTSDPEAMLRLGAPVTLPAPKRQAARSARSDRQHLAAS